MESMDGPGVATPAPWWLVLANGFAAAAAALVMLTQPGVDNLLVTLVLLALCWLWGGLLELVDLLLDRRRWGWKALGALTGVAAGWSVLHQPIWSTLLVPLLLTQTLGLLALAVAAVQLLRCVLGAGPGMAVLGGQSLALGLVLLVAPVAVLVWAAAAILTVGGVAAILMALRLRLAGLLPVGERSREFSG
jgi:uncharacterized membrane protein HdeD (DUF308 family)